mmetsp:Transcript_41160/g.118961  ORF Transcript_41160/g.118961 Transcript_41160/m.118961 type:complete len:88 (-) Transcript_41160:285-548(-)
MVAVFQRQCHIALLHLIAAGKQYCPPPACCDCVPECCTLQHRGAAKLAAVPAEGPLGKAGRKQLGPGMAEAARLPPDPCGCGTGPRA